MSNLDVDPEDEFSGEGEIESPTDGPPPDWMKTATSASDSSLTDENTPDWLKSIRAGQVTEIKKDDSEPESVPPAESESEAAIPEPSSGDDDTMSDLERLLAEEGIDLGGVADERPEEAAGMSVRDYMISTSEDEIIRNRLDVDPMLEQASPEPESLEPVEPEPIPPQPVETEPTPPPVSRPREEATSPSQPVQPDEDDKMIVEEDLPDWLREVSEVSDDREFEPTPTPAPEPPQPSFPEPEPVGPTSSSEPIAAEDVEDDKMVIEEGLPDWLSEVADEISDTQEAIEPSIAERAAAETDSVAEGEMPDWLKEVSGETAPTPDALEEADQKMVVEEELPDWIREVEETVEPAADLERAVVEPDLVDTGVDAASDDDLPGWLREVEESGVKEELDLSQFEVESEVSDLAGQADSITIDDEDLPKWLREVQEEEAEAISEPASLDSVVVNEDDLPEWLKKVQESEEELPPTAVSESELSIESEPLPETTTGSVPDLVAEDGLPDWLKEEQEGLPEEQFDLGVGIESPVSVDDTVAEEDLPDWLQEVEMGVEDIFEPSEPSPNEFFSDMPEIEGDMVVEEDLPDWLQDIEAGAEPLAEEEAEGPVPVFEAETVPASEPAAVPISDTEDRSDEVERISVAEEVEVSPTEVAEPTPAEILPRAEPVPVAQAAPSDAPDWLKKLREGTEPEEEVVEIAKAKPVPPSKPPAMSTAAAEPRPEHVAETKAPDGDGLPDDLAERLELARALREAGDIDEAARVYDSLVSSGAHLDKVIEDMQQVIKSYPSNYLLFQIMGDAMMKNGRLQSALEAYRQALTRL